MPLIGYTRNVSESGLALLVSAKSMSVLYAMGSDYTLELLLTIPGGSVEMEVTPVRYQHINEGSAGSLILIGAHITKMDDDARTRFIAYLNTFEEVKR